MGVDKGVVGVGIRVGGRERWGLLIIIIMLTVIIT